MNSGQSNKCDCMILNYWAAQNYGAILTCYGIQCLMEKLGKKTKVIKYFGRKIYKNSFNNSFTEKFAAKYLNMTGDVSNYKDFRELNKYADIFVAGSDQIWNPNISKAHRESATDSIYLLDFVENNKIKLSYSASFGTKYFNGTEHDKQNFIHFLNRFDGISVREDTGVKIVRDIFNQNAEQLIDGAFLIPKEKIDEMTANTKSAERYLGCYVLPYFKDNIWYEHQLKKISDYLNLPIKYLNFDKNTSVEEWLSFIKNSEYMITDSYHATVFSIIFNKPFIQIINANTQNRFESLYRLLDIKCTSIGINDDLNTENFISKFDWNHIGQKLDSEIKKSEQWIKNIISIKKDYCSDRDDTTDYMITELKINQQNLLKKIDLLKNKDKIYSEYIRTKICLNFTFGKTKERYKIKNKKLKSKILEIKKI